MNRIFDLSGKTAVVFGGKGKIGFPISEALCGAGAKVYICSPTSGDQDSAIIQLIEKGYDAKGISVDQSREVEVRELLEFLKQEGSPPDIMVNSGVSRPPEYVGRQDTVESWDASMATNARGTFICSKMFAEDMSERGVGSIINISSIYGIVAPDPRIYEGTEMFTESDYPYNKGGTITYSKYLASLFGHSGVRVNCIAPGGLFNQQPEPFLSRYVAKVPLGRMAYADDLYGVAIFLASDASAYITGTVIPVDGGLAVR